MAGESVTPFLGQENFAAALLLYAQALDEPNDFKAWNRMAKSLAPYYPDAPEHPWPHDDGAYNAMRVESFLATFGPDWKARVTSATRDRIAAAAAAAAALGGGPSPSEDGEDAGDGGVASPPAPATGSALPDDAAAIGAGAATDAAPGGLALEDAPEPSPVVREVLGPVVQSVRLDLGGDVAQSETSSAFGARLTAQSHALQDRGISMEGLVLHSGIEAQVRRTFQQYKDEKLPDQLLVAWATQQIERAAYYRSPQDEIEAHYLALARHARIPDEVSMRETINIRDYLFASMESDRGLQTPARLREEAANAPSPSQQSSPLPGSPSGPVFVPSTPEKVEGSAVTGASLSATPPGAGYGGRAAGLPGSPVEAGSNPASPAKTDGSGIAVDLVAALQQSNRALIEGTMAMFREERTAAAKEKEDTPSHTLPRGTGAVPGLDFKIRLPVIKDSDSDFDSFWARLKSVVAAHAVNHSKKMGPLEMFQLLKNCFPTGSVRAQIYETADKRAVVEQRLPQDAELVLEEVYLELKDAIFETDFQRKDRLEKEWAKLVMTRTTTHAAFKADWNARLQELIQYKVVCLTDSCTPDKLYRDYLSKITSNLRDAVMGKVWELDRGKDLPPRKPKTWQEVARAVDLEISSRADARAPLDHINLMDEAGSGTPALGQPVLRCKHCNRTGHPTEICPKAYAERKGEVAACLAEYEKNRITCGVCGAPDHTADHHRLAAADACYAISSDGKVTWRGGSMNLGAKRHPTRARDAANFLGGGGSQGGGQQGGADQPPAGDTRIACPFGVNCRYIATNSCRNFHPPSTFGRRGGAAEAREEAVANDNTLTVMRTEAVDDRIAKQTWENARAEEARAVARKEAAVVRAVSSAVTTRGTAAARALPRIEGENATGPSPRRAVVAASRPVPVPVIVEISGRAARNVGLVSARTVRLGAPTTQVASALRKGTAG